MKVILLQDVKGTGKRGEIAEVSDGFGRNFLIAKNMAKIATPESIHAAEKAMEAEKHKKQVEKEDAQALAKQLDGKTVQLTTKCGENGKLFGAITSKEIADAISSQLNFQIDKRNVEIDGNIKQLGTYITTVRVYAGTTAKVIVEISAK